MSVAPDGSFSYTPPAGFVGTDSFTFDVNDGVLNSLPQTVSIVVTDPPPSVPPLTYSILHDTMLIASSAPTGPAGSIPGLPGQPGGGGQGVLASALNPSGNPLTASLVRTTTDGTLVFSSYGAFRYTPNTGFAGTDSFTYVVTDGVVSSPVETVTIYVTDTAPVASPLTFSTLHDQTLLVSADQGFLSNASDADNDPLTLSIDTEPSHGTLVWNADGSFQYTPNSHWAGVDTFTYSIDFFLSHSTSILTPIHVAGLFPVDDRTCPQWVV